ncbi:hypothetical protein ACKWTF_005308 [Chironomus riparius]
MGIYEQKCFEVTKNGNAFENFMNASTISERCVKSLINLNMIDEFVEAVENKNFGTINRQFCIIKDNVFGCFEPLYNALIPCLTENEQSNQKTLNRLSESMAEFACQNLNQTTISMTIECALQKQNQLETCVEQNYGEILSEFSETFEDINFIVSQLNCTDFKNFKECVVGELNTCDQKIPANLIETLLEDIKNETPCGIKNPKSSSSSFSLSILTLFISMFIGFY